MTSRRPTSSDASSAKDSENLASPRVEWSARLKDAESLHGGLIEGEGGDRHFKLQILLRGTHAKGSHCDLESVCSHQQHVVNQVRSDEFVDLLHSAAMAVF